MGLCTIRAMASLLGTGIACHASAQWTVTSLHPEGADWSSAQDVRNGRQVGLVYYQGVNFATVWSGTSSSWRPLNPEASTDGGAMGLHGDQQVGHVYFPEQELRAASLWSGSSQTWVSLHPPGASSSVAYEIDDGRQAGAAYFAGVRRAGLWSGTPDSWVDLAPSGASESAALAISGPQQVGYAVLNDTSHACLWTGTAGSWVDLNPGGMLYSIASDVSDDGVQVGTVRFGLWPHAAMWRGSVETWIDLHPPQAWISEATGVFNGRQVGFARIDGVDHAVIWNGTAASWEDLSLTLGPEWGNSYANAVWDDGTTLYVVGRGRNTAEARDEALMWTLPLGTGCRADFNGDNQIDFFDYLDFVQAFANEEPSADFNGDQQIDFFDYLDFAVAFDLGCE